MWHDFQGSKQDLRKEGGIAINLSHIRTKSTQAIPPYFKMFVMLYNFLRRPFHHDLNICKHIDGKPQQLLPAQIFALKLGPLTLQGWYRTALSP